VPPEGLAALYPGDKGIAGDPRVLFVEYFETGSVDESRRPGSWTEGRP
jgi:hypothetical protein